MEARRPGKEEHYREPAVAAAYDRRWEGAAGRRRDLRKARALLQALETLEGAAGQKVATVLDAPCGAARFAALLRERGLAWTGADLSPAMLARAREKEPDAVLLAADLKRLPFRDGAFDAAVCIRFLHLVRDHRRRIAFLRELGRVARRGVVCDYRHDRTLRVAGRRLRHRLGLLERPPANPAPEQIAREVADAGLREVARIPVHRAPWLSDKVLVVAVGEGAARG